MRWTGHKFGKQKDVWRHLESRQYLRIYLTIQTSHFFCIIKRDCFAYFSILGKPMVEKWSVYWYTLVRMVCALFCLIRQCQKSRWCFLMGLYLYYEINFDFDTWCDLQLIYLWRLNFLGRGTEFAKNGSKKCNTVPVWQRGRGSKAIWTMSK